MSSLEKYVEMHAAIAEFLKSYGIIPEDVEFVIKCHEWDTFEDLTRQVSADMQMLERRGEWHRLRDLRVMFKPPPRS